MKGFAAVARRELAEHRMILWAALAGGILAAVSPAFLTKSRDVREVAAWFVGVAFAAGLAIALGSSAIAGPLAGRRLSFYFARPLSAASIWGGKIAGAAAVVLVAEAAGAMPAIAANGFVVSREALLVLAGGMILSIALLLPLAHAIGIAARSRSRWLGLDFAGVTVFVLGAVGGSRILVRELALAPLNAGLAALTLLAVAALFVAGFAAIQRSRTDLETAHRSLSIVLWSIALPGSALFLAYSLWTTSPRVSEVTVVYSASPAPRNDLVDIVGSARWRGPNPTRFLMELSTGRARRLPAGASDLLFSSDGRRAVSIEARYVPRGLSLFSGTIGGIQEGFEIDRFDLENGSIGRSPTGISVPYLPLSRAISADGSRIALAGSEGGKLTISVYDLSSDRLLGAAPIPDANRMHLWFLNPQRLRVYSDDASPNRPGELRVFGFDLAGRRIEELGHRAPESGFRFLRVNSDGTRLLLISSKRIVLLDGATAADVAVLSSGSRWSRNAIFLGDGRIAVGEGDAAGTRVRLFSPDGVEQKVVTTGPAGHLALGPEFEPGKLIVSRREANAWRDQEALTVDLDTGGVRAFGRHMVSVAANWWRNDLAARVAPGSPGATLFLDSAGRLMRVNPETGERRVLLPQH